MHQAKFISFVALLVFRFFKSDKHFNNETDKYRRYAPSNLVVGFWHCLIDVYAINYIIFWWYLCLFSIKSAVAIVRFILLLTEYFRDGHKSTCFSNSNIDKSAKSPTSYVIINFRGGSGRFFRILIKSEVQTNVTDWIFFKYGI